MHYIKKPSLPVIFRLIVQMIINTEMMLNAGKDTQIITNVLY